MQTVTISAFRFEGFGNAAWAFSQMQFARAPLRRIPGIGFHKLFGSGSGASFHPLPNFSVYGIMATWPSLDAAHDAIGGAGVFRRYRARSAESVTMFLEPIHAAGTWDGQRPFTPSRSEEPPRPLGVLTRATLATRSLLPFWQSVPRVSDALVESNGATFALGLGEVPWVHQVTFSIWPDAETMHRFAYKSGAHASAIRQAKEKRWFREDLFARFRILECKGTWHGRSPIL